MKFQKSAGLKVHTGERLPWSEEAWSRWQEMVGFGSDSVFPLGTPTSFFVKGLD